jgi:plastocyanin
MRVGIVFVLFLAGCHAAAARKEQIGPAPSPSNATEVVIYDYKFKPDTLRIAKGTMVTWINRDVAPHTVTRDFHDEPFDSARMGYQTRFEHRFQMTGAFSYYCLYHPSMRAFVVVE